jgi:hypothetical protein
MAQRPSRSVDELDQAARHVAYELIEMDLMAVRVLRDEYENHHLESALLHARSLIEFLIGRERRHRNDISPDDFVEGWWAPEGPHTDRLRAALPVIDQHLSHLTWTRVTQGAQSWSYPDMRNDVLGVFADFATFAAAEGCPQSEIFLNSLEQIALNGIS